MSTAKTHIYKAHEHAEPSQPRPQTAEHAERSAESAPVWSKAVGLPRLTAPILQRQEAPGGGSTGLPPITGHFGLRIREDGAVDLTVTGPEDTPVVSSPTIGIRRRPDGTFDLIVGGSTTQVTLSEIPDMLRSAVGGGSAGAGGSGTSIRGRRRFPTRRDLRSIDGTRYITFLEYRTRQMLSDRLIDLSQPLFEVLIEYYRMEDAETQRMFEQLRDMPPPPPPEYNDAVSPLPEGEAYA